MNNKITRLIIVESPSKAKTLKKILKNGYEIEASVGHIRDLPKNELGVDVNNNFLPKYVIAEDKKKIVNNIRKKVKLASELYLATDPDREGEAISWHIIEAISPNVPIKRLVFHEITKEAIMDAFNKTRDIDISLVKAQESRRILDRLFGYLVSKKLWLNVKRNLSAGRVQSPAIKLIVDLEKKRSAFKENEFWKIKGIFLASDLPFEANLIKIGNNKIATSKDFDKHTGNLKSKNSIVLDNQKVEKLTKSLLLDKWAVETVEQKPKISNPSPPFITSTLQQEGVRKLRMTSRRVMSVAQRLYEKGLITYMRTDSITLSSEAINAARSEIIKHFGDEYLPNTPRQYKSKVKNAQEAHEAIRPAGSLFKNPNNLQNKLESDEFKLYELIWKRTIASQMKSAKILQTNAKITNGNEIFEAIGKVIQFPGYFKIYVHGRDDKTSERDDQEKTLPILKNGQSLLAQSFQPEQRFTKPWARFTEATLIKELENLGIGRPSTYASIMVTIQRRGYVRREKGKLIPTFTAYAVVHFLEKYFKDLVNLQFTAELENTLDAISNNEKVSAKFLKTFYLGEKNQIGLSKLLDQEFDKQTSKTILSYQKNDNAVFELRIGRYGLYVQIDEKRANVPDDSIPSDFTIDHINTIFENKEQVPQSLGTMESTDEKIFLKNGRYGIYLQAGKKMKSLLPGMVEEDVDETVRNLIHDVDGMIVKSLKIIVE